MAESSDALLLGMSAPLFRDVNGRLMVERQSILGLKAWRDNFSSVTAFSICHDGPAPSGWLDAEAEGISGPAIEIVAVPNTYDFRTRMRHRRRISGRMLDLMKKANYRTFAYGGWLGDPGEIAASIARRHRLAHAVWFDRVESQIARSETGNSLPGRIKGWMRASVFAYHENRAARSADLALLHGATVFEHFKEIAHKPHKVEDVHFTEDDRIPHDFIQHKLADIRRSPLRILYCGRAAAMKGPFDWVKVLGNLKGRGVPFQARWLGDGELLDQMREAAQEAGLSPDELIFDGFVADPEKVREAYRRAHVLLFCHLTDESPRNLIESLHSATPLLGYRDPYSAGLVAEKGAGILVERGDVGALTEAVEALASDGTRLCNLVVRASESVRHLTRANVFRHRSEIIRNQLKPQC